MNKLQNEIKNKSTSCINDDGIRPNAVYVRIRLYDERSPSKNVETIVIDENSSFYPNDDEILFYAPNINYILQLCEEDNGEDFVITEFIGFGSIKH